MHVHSATGLDIHFVFAHAEDHAWFTGVLLPCMNRNVMVATDCIATSRQSIEIFVHHDTVGIDRHLVTLMALMSLMLLLIDCLLLILRILVTLMTLMTHMILVILRLLILHLLMALMILVVVFCPHD